MADFSAQHQYFVIYKPYGMLSQFSDDNGRATLGELFSFPKDVYPVGRLDQDSEGLLILTNDKNLNHKLLNPVFKHKRKYWVQVDGAITKQAVEQLANGVEIKVNKSQYRTLPASAMAIETPEKLPERNPPVRFRKNIPTSWLSLELTEGKNRQVRKMTAKVGFPTLRLIRVAIGKFELGSMQPGDVLEIPRRMAYQKFLPRHN
ncbi:pseudouridine synthase [Flexithrix dorotheae]|uniref:pseudouridine synthase n=1 Tax=Flexithrix dorotheae TaxID=70993 RepID=UPI00035C7AA3|nr:pseudouridine synthase [Flexithrix dorotheae]